MKACAVAAISITALVLATVPAFAQGQAPRSGQLPPAGGQGGPSQRGPAAKPAPAPQPTAGKSYKPVAITAPVPVSDPTFAAFRKKLGSTAGKKDRKALADLVAADFFWTGEKGDKADKKKSGIENLAKAIELDGKDAPGWELLGAASADPTAEEHEERKDTICAPADPTYNDEEFEALTKSTKTEEDDWGFPTQTGLEVRSGPQPNSPVIEKLGMHFVRIVIDEKDQPGPTLRVITPSGKNGYVPSEALSALGNDQLCYTKEAGGWKISGFIGGEQ